MTAPDLPGDGGQPVGPPGAASSSDAFAHLRDGGRADVPTAADTAPGPAREVTAGRGAAALPGWAAALIFLAGSILWVVVWNVGLVGVLFGIDMASGGEGLDGVMGMLQTPLVMAASAAGQSSGMVALAALLLWVSGRGQRVAFALRRPGPIALAAGLLLGGTAGLFAGWVGEIIPRHLPALDSDVFDVLARAVGEGPLLPRLALIAAIVLAAPLLEELVFRGFLWDSLERSMGRRGAWIATSLLFAAYHVVPLHVLSVFGTGLLIGALRLASRSIWPCVVAHFVNNLLGVGLILLPGDDEWSTSGRTALAGLLASCLAVLAVLRWGRPCPAPGPLVASSEPGEST